MALAARTVCYAECDVCGNEEEVTATDYIHEVELIHDWMFIWDKLYCWECKPQKHTVLTAHEMSMKRALNCLAESMNRYLLSTYRETQSNFELLTRE